MAKINVTNSAARTNKIIQYCRKFCALIFFFWWTCRLVHTSAARCQLFKFDLISALSNSIFDIIGLAQTSQKYHQRFLRTDKNYNFCINFIKMLFNIFIIKPIFGDFVIQYWFSKLFDAGLSIVCNRFWVHIRCRFGILKYYAALVHTYNIMGNWDWSCTPKK